MKTWLATAGGAVALLGGSLALWGTWGWVTRGEYTRDHVDAPTAQQILAEVKAAREQSELAHQHWECDEIFEEIQEEESGPRRRNLETRFDRLDCWRFDTD